MYAVSILEPESYEDWDEFVLSHNLGNIYDTTLWKEVLEETFQHITAKNLVLTRKDTGQIKAALPLYQVKSWLTGSRLVSVPFGTLCDPLVSSNEESRMLLDHAMSLKKEYHCDSLQIKVFQGSELIRDERIRLRTTHKHHYLLLGKEFEKITKTFKRTVRQAVRRATESGLEVCEGRDESDLRSFYGLYTQTRKRNAVPTQPYRFFDNLWKKFGNGHGLSILLVKKGKEAVCAGILLNFKNRVTLEFLASDKAALSLRPNHLLVWNAIKMAIDTGQKVFDFGRTAPEDAGLMRFKDSWGTNVVDLLEAFESSNLDRNKYDRTRTSWKTVSYLCRVSPLPLYRILSAYCYRHLG